MFRVTTRFYTYEMKVLSRATRPRRVFVFSVWLPPQVPTLSVYYVHYVCRSNYYWALTETFRWPKTQSKELATNSYKLLLSKIYFSTFTTLRPSDCQIILTSRLVRYVDCTYLGTFSIRLKVTCNVILDTFHRRNPHIIGNWK